MTVVEEKEHQITAIIEESVDKSVEKAFKKYGKRAGGSGIIRSITSLLFLCIAVFVGIYIYQSNTINKPVAPVEDHDLTLENNGIFGFTVADFQEPILGVATRQKLLVVEEQEVFVNTTITETGLFNWGVFNKQQALTIYGMGQYTVDLSKISAADISLDEDTYEITIRIPHAALHQTIFDASKTEIGDTKKGWLAVGSIQMTAEQQKEFEIAAVDKLETKLSEDARFKEADRFAKLSIYETYQPVIKAISPAYKAVIEFQ